MEPETQQMEPGTQAGNITLFLKNKSIYIITALVVTIAFLSFCNYKYAGLMASRENVDNEYTEGSTLLSQDLLTEEIRDSINTYFKEANMEDYISEDDMEKLTALITSEVLNSLPSDSLSESQQDEIRTMIASAMQTIIKEQNSKLTNTIEQSESIITKELQEYIKESVVPSITATIQIAMGEIEDLKKSLTNISNEYVTNNKKYDALFESIQNQINNMSNSGASQADLDKLKQDLNSLSIILQNYKSQSSSQVTDLESELARAKAELMELTEQQLADIKAAFSAQITNNNNLLDDQKESLLELINSLNASNIADLNSAIDALQKQIAEESEKNEQEMLAAIEAIRGKGDGSTTTMDELLDQIKNSELTDAQKQQLILYLEQNYGKSTEYTDSEIADLKDQLSASISNESKYLMDAVNGLESTLASEVEKLQKSINELAKKDSELQKQIDNLGELSENELEEVKKGLLDELNNYKDLTDEDRKNLEDAINSIDAKNAADITNIQNYLTEVLEQQGNTNIAVNNAISSLNVDLDGIRTTIQNNKNESDAKDAALEQQISDVNGSLGGWTFFTGSDGHLYGTYHKGEADEVTKKLTFAQ